MDFHVVRQSICIHSDWWQNCRVKPIINPIQMIHQNRKMIYARTVAIEKCVFVNKWCCCFFFTSFQYYSAAWNYVKNLLCHHLSAMSSGTRALFHSIFFFIFLIYTLNTKKLFTFFSIVSVWVNRQMVYLMCKKNTENVMSNG